MDWYISNVAPHMPDPMSIPGMILYSFILFIILTIFRTIKEKGYTPMIDKQMKKARQKGFE